MPQPFKGDWIADPEALSKRPKLGLHVGIIASLWSHMEYGLASLIANILNVDAAIASKMYLPVKSEAARLSIIEAIAKENLNAEMRSEFNKLRIKIRNTGAERD